MASTKPGRPRGTTKPDNRQSLTIRLPPDLLEALKAMPKRGYFIESAIREKLDAGTNQDFT